MPLTSELIKANAALTGLTAEQISAISTLSANDEATVISAKIGEHHGKIETDVLTVSGLAKNEGEKSYDYVKRALTSYKEKAGSVTVLQGQIDTQKTTIADLDAKILAGKGNEAVAQKLKDAESKLGALQTQYETDKGTWTTEKADFTAKITGVHVNAEISKATSGLKFKATFPESVQKTLLKAAKDTVLGQYKPDWIEAAGVKTMVFRDATGEILRNKSNKMEPYSAQELISEQLADTLETGRNKNGAGTGSGGGGGEEIETADISAARSQIEADDLIAKHLMQKGLTRGTPAFAEAQTKIRVENNVSKLPMKI
jgi:hypothetical protein